VHKTKGYVKTEENKPITDESRNREASMEEKRRKGCAAC